MVNNFNAWFEKKRVDIIWDLFFSCLIELLIMFAVMLLIAPYFETLHSFWYVFFLIFLPLYIFSETASALAKIKVAAQKQQAVVSIDNHTLQSALPIAQEWQCMTIKTGLLALLPAFGCAVLYYFSSKSIEIMLLLAVVVGLSVFITSALIVERHAKSLAINTLLKVQETRQFDEPATINFLLIYHCVPWLFFASLTYGGLMSRYYFGYVSDSGQIGLSSLASYSYMSCTFVAFWSYFNVASSIKTDLKLQPMFLSGIGKLSDSDLYGMLFGAGLLPWSVLFLCGFWLPTMADSVWLSVIALSTIVFGVFVGVGAAVLAAFSELEPVLPVEANS